MVHRLNKEVFMVVQEKENTKIMVSIMKVVEFIGKLYPYVEVVNLGETDFIISYVIPKPKKLYIEYLKTGFVCLVVFFGAAFSIMTFNTDVDVSGVFSNIYQLVLGEGSGSNRCLEVSYSIGISMGILLFFNHFSHKKMHQDPTPLQIEMRKYEEDINTALIKNASKEGITKDAN